ncbi:MAG TPA: hypothetical protein VMQ38_05305 [Mycobacterium sp.]|jgi:hypothetical protein|nr:hypothetical protein [Mycobacterium sp.]
MADNELDVRQLRKPDKHPAIFATYAVPDATGAVWKLQARERDLDSNVIALPLKSPARQAV